MNEGLDEPAENVPQPELKVGAGAHIVKAWRGIRHQFGALYRKLPILGRLNECRWIHLREAFYEVGCVLLFSTLPLWFFPIMSWMLFTIGFPISEVVENGELLIYAASFSGTMVYFISKRYGSFQTNRDTGEGPAIAISISFPYGGLFVIVSALICMFSAAAFLY